MGKVFAITWLSIKEATRRKIPLYFSIFCFVLIAGFPYFIKGDGTARGQAQILLTYTINFSLFFLSMLNILLSVSILRKEWREKILFLLDTKTITRWEILVGKFLGLMVVNLIIICCIYAATQLSMHHVLRHSEGEDKQIAQDQVITSRTSIGPIFGNDIIELAKSYKKRYSVEKGKRYIWQFPAVDIPENVKSVTFRYKYYSSSRSDDHRLRVGWTFGDPTVDRGYFRVPTHSKVNRYHEITLPTAIFKPGKPFRVEVINAPVNENSLLFPIKDGVQILVKQRSFSENLAYAMLIIWVQMGLLVAAGLMCTTWLSSPVSLLCLFTLYFLLISVGFFTPLLERSLSTQDKPRPGQPAQQETVADQYGRLVVTIVKVVVPDYGALSPVSYVNRGFSLPRSFIWVHNVLFIGLRIVLLLALAGFIFSTRELSAIKDA